MSKSWRPLPILHFHFASGIIAADTEMDQIELVPDLSHCIETVARREYENLARNYLQSGKGDSELGEKIELLRSFLESADFRKLRLVHLFFLKCRDMTPPVPSKPIMTK